MFSAIIVIILIIRIVIIAKNKNKKFLLKHIIIVDPTKYELKFIAKNRGIKNYQNMSREELLSTLDKSEHITKNLSKMGLSKLQECRIFH